MTPEYMKVIIAGLGPKAVTRQIDRRKTCEELKRELKASLIVSCGGRCLEGDYIFHPNEFVEVLGRIKGGMEVNVY